MKLETCLKCVYCFKWNGVKCKMNFRLIEDIKNCIHFKEDK